MIAESNESTVVAEFIPDSRAASGYQSEAQLERDFTTLLEAQGYEYLTIHDEASLISNLRRQLETLNDYIFSDSEWNQFFSDCIASSNEGIVEKSRKIQTDHVQLLQRDNGSTKNIYLLDKKISSTTVYRLSISMKKARVHVIPATM